MKRTADATQTARLLKALSAPMRLRIVQLLAGRALCVNALARLLKAGQPAVSQHLRVLREAGLVTPEKRGYFVHYRLEPGRLAAARTAVNALLTPSRPTKAATTKGVPPCPRSPKRGAKSPRT